MDIQKEENRYKHIEISQVDAFAEWEASDSEEAVPTNQECKHKSQAMPQYPSLDELEMEDGQASSHKSKKKLF